MHKNICIEKPDMHIKLGRNLRLFRSETVTSLNFIQEMSARSAVRNTACYNSVKPSLPVQSSLFRNNDPTAGYQCHSHTPHRRRKKKKPTKDRNLLLLSNEYDEGYTCVRLWTELNGHVCSIEWMSAISWRIFSATSALFPQGTTARYQHECSTSRTSQEKRETPKQVAR